MNLPAAPDISGRVRAEIERAGLSQAKVMFQIDMSSTTWDRRMKTPGEWRMRELDAIASVLGIPVERLLVGGTP